ncbi:zinc finger protein 106-like [Brienomyrus brachyistius]|uniref:zinc finger protein 106-like n=1 Tax=Brienomyrus brachyistius TaxID=42636 RepID=UPI0020B1D4CB|nr:zinc finger protein 106-like [Brienomyrus brachyistius]
MERERICILCHIVYNSKQEMDEHVRSMLHHRELENLKGRDCSHECRVCRVSVVGLTEYASHISSPLHKQRVQARWREDTGAGRQERYFHEELACLIEKRKELNRIEEEEAKKQTKKEEERLKQQKHQMEQQRVQRKDGQQRWGYPRYPQLSKGFSMPSWQGNGGEWGSARVLQDRPWSSRHQSRAATWHAEGGADLQKWRSVDEAVGGLGSAASGVGTREYVGIPLRQKHHISLPSSDCSSNLSRGGRFYWDQMKEPLHKQVEADFRSDGLPRLDAINFRKGHGAHTQEHEEWSEGLQSHMAGDQSKDGTSGDKSKGRASNLKEKVNRWAPYPPAKYNEMMPWKEVSDCVSEDYPTVTPGLEQNTKSDSDLLQCNTQSVHTSGRELGGWYGVSSAPQNDQGKDREHSESSSLALSSSIFREPTSGTFSKSKSIPDHRPSTCDSTELKPHEITLNSPKNHEPNSQDQRLTELMGKTKAFLKENSEPVNASTAEVSMETVLFIEEKQGPDGIECEAGEERELFKANKNLNSGYSTEGSRLACSLQSIQVSTSTCNIAEHSVPSILDQGNKVDIKEAGHQEEDDGRELAEQTIHTMDEGFGSDNEAAKKGRVPQCSSSEVPDLSKLGLPASLKRDLTRHIGSKHKTGTHEPNLNIARRIRSLSGIRKGEAENDSGLKPTLRQIISCCGSRRNVNWDQVYLEVCRRRQEQGRGMPRFGIEMVTQVQYEEDIPFAEGFDWKPDSALNGGTQRERSFSESSLVTDHTTTTTLALFARATHSTDTSKMDLPGRGTGSDASATSGPACVKAELEGGMRGGCISTVDLSEPQKVAQGHESIEGYSSCTSGPEINDMQQAGKKRRAAGDVPSPEIPSLERKSKRMKIKSKKERSQVDQLLAVSLREEQLSGSLQAVDASLIQARAALQATYMEVQRLLLVKQQVTMEMSTLRTKRIEILQGMKEEYTDIAEPGEKATAEEPAAAATSTLPASALPTSTLSSSLSPPTNTPCHVSGTPSQNVPPPSSERPASSPSLPSADATAAMNNLHVQGDPPFQCILPPDSLGRVLLDLHDASQEASCNTKNADQSPSIPTRSLSAESRQASFDSQESASVHSEHSQDYLKGGGFTGSVQYLSGGHLQDPTALVKKCPASAPIEDTGDKTVRATAPTSHRDSGLVATETVSGSQGGRAGRPCTPQREAQPSLPSTLPESKSGNRVRRLKKKKMLRKALGGDQPENSDTELDGEPVGRPVRKLKSRKKAKGSPVSTSSVVTKGKEQDATVDGKVSPPSRYKQHNEDVDSMADSCLKMVELPQAKFSKAISVESSDSDDGSTLHTPASKKSSTSNALSPPPAMPKAEPPALACDEVTSTSELDAISRPKTCSNKMQQCLPSVKESKLHSDVSLQPGDEEELCEGLFEGHQAAISAMQIHNGLLYTCSGDRTVRAFDLANRKCVAVFEGHSTKVNCLLVLSGPGLQQRLYTGSSDQTIRCYSLKTKECQDQFVLSDRVLCLHSRWKILYAGLANGTVVSFSLKTKRQLDVFECHGPRAVSCLASAQEGARRLLLVGSYDCTISVRDAKSGLLLRTLEGHTKTVLCMKVVNDLVFSGSSDQSVHAYNIHTGELVRIYKGHSHAVTAITIMGKVMVTACLDKLVRVYELQSHNQLQVYGGHKDMVMCMALHKGMIYTGCYDGSVQAVRLNLIKNHRCWWQGCSVVFGVMEHLQQHVLTEHVSPNLHTLRCRWRNCDALFSTRNNSKQDAPKHMLRHTEEDCKLDT